MRLLAASVLLSAATAAFASGVAATAASPDDAFPRRQEGLWEVRSVGSDAVGMPAALYCVGEQTDTADSHLDRSAGARGSCSLGRFVQAGDAWVAESICREGRTTVTKRAIASGDFETEYRIDTLVTQTIGTGVRREDREAVVARRIGPCEDGQRPGDLVIPGMGTLNMEDGTFQAEAPPRPPPKPPARKPPARQQ
jgi:hypothetical protein